MSIAFVLAGVFVAWVLEGVEEESPLLAKVLWLLLLVAALIDVLHYGFVIAKELL